MEFKNVIKGITGKIAANADFIQEFCKTATNLYRLGWDERNGGNMSMLLDETEVKKYIDTDDCIRELARTCRQDLPRNRHGQIFQKRRSRSRKQPRNFQNLRRRQARASVVGI